MTRRSTAPGPQLLLLSLLVLSTLIFERDPVRLSAVTDVFDPRFGAVEAFRARDRADLAGVRWTRLVFLWGEIQRNGPSSWNQFYFPDALLEDEFNSGRRVVGVLVGTPGWAGDGSPNSVPHGLDHSVDDPANLWAGFARAMAARYQGRIDHWVVWNEPDVWDPASPTHTWAGSLEQFYRLQKVGYLALKQGNPSAQVGLAGLTYWWDHHHDREQYFARYLRVAAADPEAPEHGWFFDAAVLHLYNEPEGLYRAPTLFRALMAERGFAKPIWINETNVAPWDDPANPQPRADFRASLDEQASYLVQAFAYGLAGGAQHIAVYPFSDEAAPLGQERMGLVRADGTTRPAYQAFQTVTRHLSGVQAATLVRQDAAVVVVLERAGGTTTVAWAAGPQPTTVELPARGEEALLVDKYGQGGPVAAEGGRYRLPLEPATANTVNGDPARYLIGGSPLLLIE